MGEEVLVGDPIQISQASAAEFDLVQNLRAAIFVEFPHIFKLTVAQTLSGREDVQTWIASVDGKPVGLNIGYRFNGLVYYITLAGVLADYRSRGIMTLLHQRQLEFAKSRGYKRIEFNTFNHFPQM